MVERARRRAGSSGSPRTPPAPSACRLVVLHGQDLAPSAPQQGTPSTDLTTPPPAAAAQVATRGLLLPCRTGVAAVRTAAPPAGRPVPSSDELLPGRPRRADRVRTRRRHRRHKRGRAVTDDR